MNILDIAIAKKYINLAQLGLTSISVNGLDIILEKSDGSTAVVSVPEPEDGVSVVGMIIDENNCLVCQLSDGNSINAGEIPTISSDVETLVKEEVTKQIETQLQDTIQETVDEAIEDALSGGSGDGTGSNADDEINSWFQ